MSEVADQLISARSEHASHLSSLRKDLAGEQELCIDLKHRLKEAKLAEKDLRAQLSNVTSAQAKKDAAWTTKVQDFEKALAMARVEATPKHGELAEAKSKLAFSERQLADAQSKIVRTEAELASTSTKLEKATEKAAGAVEAVAKVAEMTKRLQALKEELSLEKNTKMEFHSNGAHVQKSYPVTHVLNCI